MKLMLPLVAMFIFMGLTQTTVTRRAYWRMLVVILVVALYYFFTWQPQT